MAPQGSQAERMPREASFPIADCLLASVPPFLSPCRLEKMYQSMTARTCKIRRRNPKHKRQPRRTNRTRSQSNPKHEAQNSPLLLGRMQPQNHRDGHHKDPQVRHHVGHIGKVCKGLLIDAPPPSLVPPRLDGPASKAQDNLHDDDPGADEAGGADDEDAERAGDEDAVVEGQDGELGEGDCNVVKVAEDVVALGRVSAATTFARD